MGFEHMTFVFKIEDLFYKLRNFLFANEKWIQRMANFSSFKRVARLGRTWKSENKIYVSNLKAECEENSKKNHD